MNTYTLFQLVSAGLSHPGQRRQLNQDAWRIAGQRRQLNQDAWRIAGQNDAPHLWPERGRLFAIADSPRPVALKRNDKGLWKASEWSSLSVGIKPPAATISDDL